MTTTNISDKYGIDQLFGQLRKENIRVPDSQAVQEYILSHQGMFEVVAQAAALTAAQLGERADLSLELSRDPEIDDPTLLLYVRPWSKAVNVHRAIDHAECKIAGALERAQGWLTIMPDYRVHA